MGNQLHTPGPLLSLADAQAHSDFVESVGLMLAAVGYTEEYARQWPNEKVSVTFKRWFDEQIKAAQGSDATPLPPPPVITGGDHG